MYLKNVVFFQQIGEDIFCFFSFCNFSFFLFLFSRFFFFLKVCVTNPFIFELFLEFLVNPCSLFTFSHEKSAQKPSFFVSAQSLFCFTFAFNIFPYFLSSLFLSSFFPSFLFVHPFLLFFSFSLLSFLHSFFISLSQCFSFSFFLYLMFTHLFFSIAVVAYPLFVLTHFSSVSLF